MQETNCHPYRHGRWLFVHNGLINEFHTVRRELMLAVDPALFVNIQGSTDSEVLFHLALTYGLEQDPLAALERTIGFVEAAADSHGIEHAVQASIGVSDGERLWAVRYSTEGNSRTLFASADVHALKQLHPENPRLALLRDGRPHRGLGASRGPSRCVARAYQSRRALIVLPGGAHEQRPFHPLAVEATG